MKIVRSLIAVSAAVFIGLMGSISMAEAGHGGGHGGCVTADHDDRGRHGGVCLGPNSRHLYYFDDRGLPHRPGGLCDRPRGEVEPGLYRVT